jgi:hypothetical protein
MLAMDNAKLKMRAKISLRILCSLNNGLRLMRGYAVVRTLKFFLGILSYFYTANLSAQGIIEVSQGNISGNALGFLLGDPLGQSFHPKTTGQLGGIVLGLVNVNTPAPLSVLLFRTDASGVIIGSPLASGSLNAQEVNAFATDLPATPIYVAVMFDSPYSQLAGESLAFSVGYNPLPFYYGPGNSYLGGQVLGDATKDLVFTTLLVPEPSTIAFIPLGLLILLSSKKSMSRLENRFRPEGQVSI